MYKGKEILNAGCSKNRKCWKHFPLANGTISILDIVPSLQMINVRCCQGRTKISRRMKTHVPLCIQSHPCVHNELHINIPAHVYTRKKENYPIRFLF